MMLRGGRAWSSRLWRREVRAETLIAAPPERVWALLTDLASYPSWNRFMPRVQGDLVPGGEVQAEVRFSRGFLGVPLRFRAQVLRCDSCREIRWVGKLLSRWLFGGVHSFVLEPAPNAPGVGTPVGGGVLLVHREVLSGLLLPVLGWYLAPLMEEGFREMNEALRAQAESA
ncbi:MAG: SRPBCC family protein [Thermoleophilia bacterium]